MDADPAAGQPCQQRQPLLLGFPGTRGGDPGPPPKPPQLNVPVRSLKMLDMQIAAGANEVFLGVRPSGSGLSFDSLPASRDGQPTHVASFALLEELVGAAHRAGVRVHFCADAPVVAPEQRDAYLTHVRAGLRAGADTVVVGGLAACAWVADELPEAVLVAGANLVVNSPRYAAHLRDSYGVARIVLPHLLTLQEIADFHTVTGVEVEVCVQTGSGLDCSSCRIADLPGIGLGCRSGYTGSQDGQEPRDLAAFLDGASDCALCDVPALVDLGVAALQVAGRESPNLRQNAKVTQLYRRALDDHAQGVDITDTIERIDRTELMWQMGWVPRLCDQQRCRFRDTPQRHAYV